MKQIDTVRKSGRDEAQKPENSAIVCFVTRSDWYEVVVKTRREECREIEKSAGYTQHARDNMERFNFST